MSQVAIIDTDCIASAGVDVDRAWDNLSHNGSGLCPLTRYDPAATTLQGVSFISHAGQIPLSYEEMAGSAARLEKWREPCYHALRTLAGRIFGRIGFDASHAAAATRPGAAAAGTPRLGW